MLGDPEHCRTQGLDRLAGPRVIEQTIRQKLPPVSNAPEYLLDHGMVDMIVSVWKCVKLWVKVLAILTRPSRRRPVQGRRWQSCSGDDDSPSSPALNEVRRSLSATTIRNSHLRLYMSSAPTPESSTAAFLAAMLTQAGYCTRPFYVSPSCQLHRTVSDQRQDHQS